VIVSAVRVSAARRSIEPSTERRPSKRSIVQQILYAMEGTRSGLSQILQDEVYRIEREHAHASRIEAEVAHDSQFFRLRIRDNGKGIDPTILEQGAGTEVPLTLPARIACGRLHLREGLRLSKSGPFLKELMALMLR
jgi:hypothetical protein